MNGKVTLSWRGMPARALRQVLALVLLPALVLTQGSSTRDGTADEPPTARDGTGLVLSQVLGVRDLPAAGAPTSPGDRRRTARWGWPLVGVPPVVATFDPPAQRWLPGHRGIDLAGIAGEAVLAVDAGVVTFSGTVGGVGVVSVTHEGGLRSTYQPVEDPAARGARVRRGQRIGTLGTTASHCLVQDCLHLGAVRGPDTYVDPLPLLLGAELTLLPVGP